MAQELLILRHGKAHRPDASGGAPGDVERELKDKGKRNAQRIGVWLARHDLLPDLVVSSPATRAQRTAEKCCKSAGLRGDGVTLDERIYEGDVNGLLDVLRATPQSIERVMMVGHNPSLENLLVRLSRDFVPRNEKDGFLVPAALAHLRLDCDWRDVDADCADVLDIIEPRTLPRLFPFPDLNGPEERTRPAYYYRQSSVIPFRRTGDGLEVLIISSSKNKHWVVPKGIHDPGLSAQESAAKEAYEEAGVEGQVLDRMIGSYQYAKWDATCDVAVYPMNVTREIPESEWQERHRGRQWMAVDEAAALVLNDDVKRLIAQLPSILAETEA